MSDWYVLDENNRPVKVDMMTGARSLEAMNRQVALDHVNGCQVSTVFLVFDHSFTGGNPILWETMVFDSKAEYEPCERYTNYEDAVAGHAAMIERVKSGEFDGEPDE